MRNTPGKAMGAVSCAAMVVASLASGPAMLGEAAAARPAEQAAAATPADPLIADKCARLANTVLPGGAEINSAMVVAKADRIEGATLLPGVGPPLTAPKAFCRVIGHVSNEPGSNVGFETWLPMAGWDGRLHGTGNGGFAGLYYYGQMASAIAAGQATVGTDTGHQGAMDDASWAKGHPARVRDYAYRGVHVSAVAAKQVIAKFYGRGPDHAIFSSCSNGGRQALIEAGRYPEDYDGIVAGAPASNFTDLTVTMIAGYRAQMLPGAALRRDQADLLQKRVIEDCDTLDGLKDGLVSNPLQCRVAVRKLLCDETAAKACFSPQQVHALEALYAGPHDSRGRPIGAGGFTPSGAEAGPLGWGTWLFAGQPGGATQSIGFPRGIFSNFTPAPLTSVETYDFDRDPAIVKAALGGMLDASPNLRSFFARGGKLAIYHGWGDPAVPPKLTLRYYKAMLAQSGAKARASSVLFMVPGLQHCLGGPGPVDFGQLLAPLPTGAPEHSIIASVQSWVATGRRPSSLIGRLGGAPALPDGTRPERLLCAEPQKPVLAPGGNPDLAASYSCKATT